MTNWFNRITKEMEKNGDSWECLEASTLDDNSLFQEFEYIFRGPNVRQFVLWTRTHVYFSREYDGKDYVDSVERNP